MRLKIILDGYNVIGKIDSLTRVKDRDGLERSREALAAMLADRTGRRGGREFIIVFDGQGSDGSLPAASYIRGIKCYFTRRGVEADDFIGDLLAAMKDKRQVAVISADNKVANKCRVHGVPVSPPSALREERGCGRAKVCGAEKAKDIPEGRANDITRWYGERLGITKK